MDLRVGNKYRIGRKIGSGSFGDIYLGKFMRGSIVDNRINMKKYIPTAMFLFNEVVYYY